MVLDQEQRYDRLKSIFKAHICLHVNGRENDHLHKDAQWL
jgi:hypothetical protein